MKHFLILLIVTCLFVFSCTNKKGELPLKCDSTVHYTSNIAQIISTNCMGSHGSNCHNSGSSNSDYTTYEGLKQQADIGGKLWENVVKTRKMPQGSSLSETEIRNIHCWIHQGAPNN